ncbi:hypothetical protein ABZ297_45210 [Nonomuraea sp. NPDC005983]|uniref:hypothetical protein n=1 Tax=Nonomuraea sp. NPDC005983 TaxID=3155595 RepID=UPI0033AD5AF4
MAGGELLIPTIVLLYSVDIKTAGSLSLVVSLPTMLVAFARYSRDGSFAVLGANLRFAAVMVAGSINGGCVDVGHQRGLLTEEDRGRLVVVEPLSDLPLLEDGLDLPDDAWVLGVEVRIGDRGREF